MGSKDDTDRCAGSRVMTPRRASVEVSTNSVTTCILDHAVAETFQSAPAAIVSLLVASSRSVSWKRRDLETRRVY